MPQIIINGTKEDYFDCLRRIRLVDGLLDQKAQEGIYECAYAFGRWLGRMFESEYFDFGTETGYMEEGKKIIRSMFKFRRHFTVNPDLVFLDRTRYGLIRIFQQLKCRIPVWNHYEYGDSHPKGKGAAIAP